jgi:outer membrane immunogenic protein
VRRDIFGTVFSDFAAYDPALVVDPAIVPQHEQWSKSMRHFCASAFVAVLAIAAAAPASAADLAPRMPTKAPPLIAPPVAWTGCYIGANIGGGWAHKHYTDPVPVPPVDLGSHTADGVVGGGQIGCDYQAGAWVFGVQGMFDGADLQAEHLALGDFYATRIPWFATATARIGYTLQPNLLAYVKGGGAWVRDRETKTDLVTGLVEGTADVTRSGWTVGGGLEYLFWSNWSVFVEYNYMDFGTHRTILAVPEAPFPLDIRQNMSAVLVGLNYRFNFAR